MKQNAAVHKLKSHGIYGIKNYVLWHCRSKTKMTKNAGTDAIAAERVISSEIQASYYAIERSKQLELQKDIANISENPELEHNSQRKKESVVRYERKKRSRKLPLFEVSQRISCSG